MLPRDRSAGLPIYPCRAANQPACRPGQARAHPCSLHATMGFLSPDPAGHILALTCSCTQRAHTKKGHPVANGIRQAGRVCARPASARFSHMPAGRERFNFPYVVHIGIAARGELADQIYGLCHHAREETKHDLYRLCKHSTSISTFFFISVDFFCFLSCRC